MACKDSGKIISIGSVESGTSGSNGRDWRKLDVAIEWGDKYKNQLCLTAFNDKVDQVQNLSIGDHVIVEYNATSRPWTKDGVTKWFHNISLVSINLDADAGSTTYTPSSLGASQPEEDDLPF
jgi:hypothetical protein